MRVYNNVGTMLDDIRKRVRGTIDSVILNDVIPIMIQQIEVVVYGAYDSQAKNPYERRYEHGGLLSAEHIKYEILDTKDGFHVMVRNFAPISEKHNAPESKYSLDRLIVDGSANWRNSEWYANRHERDFYEATAEVLRGSFANILSAKLRSVGLEVDLDVSIESKRLARDFEESIEAQSRFDWI